jgi:quercetin dioxygenase-like cupin family protein
MPNAETHYFSGGVYANRMDFQEAGSFGVQHKHNYDHLSILASGSVLLEVEGSPNTVHKAPAALTIVAGKTHKVTALEANSVWFCIHAVPSDLQVPNPTKEAIEATLIKE